MPVGTALCSTRLASCGCSESSAMWFMSAYYFVATCGAIVHQSAKAPALKEKGRNTSCQSKLITELAGIATGSRLGGVREFTIPFVRAANRVRVYGSPASIAAMDEIQEGFAMLNRAKGEAEREAAGKAIRT